MEEDNNTRQALDELADLFLTGTSAQSRSQNGSRSTNEQPRDASAATQSSQTSQSPQAAAPKSAAVFDEDSLGGPAPIRLSPKPSRPALGPATHTRSRGADVDTPPLRLHRDEPDDADDQPSSPLDRAVAAAVARGNKPQASATLQPAAASVEAVIMGNLPGLNGPWLTQYAQLIAQHEGRVAVLHVDEERIDAEVLEPIGRSTSAGRTPPGRPQPDLLPRLEALVRDEQQPVRLILAHLEPTASPAGLERLRAIDDWTVICGADDAAVAAASRTLHELIEAEPEFTAKRVGLMIMGSDADDSRAAAERLIANTASLFQTPVQLVGCQRQMMPVNLRQIGRFAPTDVLWPRLTHWFSKLVAPPGSHRDVGQPLEVLETQSTSHRRSLAEDIFDSADLAELDRVDPTAEDESVFTAEDESQQRRGWWRALRTPPAAKKPVAESIRAEAAEPVASVEAPEPIITEPALEAAPEQVVATAPRTAPTPSKPAPPPKPEQPRPAVAAPQAAPVAEPVAPSAPEVSAAEFSEPELASFLTTGKSSIAGGLTLEARCPHQPLTQLVLDQAGRLHLLRRHNSSDANLSLSDLRKVIVDLIEAQQWVREHLQVLQLTQRQCRFDDKVQPVLHLFTDRADLATPLAAKLGDNLKLHLLQNISVGAQSTWFCTPLN